MLENTEIRVEELMGCSAPAVGLESSGILVATAEKANSLVNTLATKKQLDSLACVVVYEVTNSTTVQMAQFSTGQMKTFLTNGYQPQDAKIQLEYNGKSLNNMQI